METQKLDTFATQPKAPRFKPYTVEPLIMDTLKSGQPPYNGQTVHPLPMITQSIVLTLHCTMPKKGTELLGAGKECCFSSIFKRCGMDTLKSGQPPYNGPTVHPLPIVHTFLPPKKGQPLNNGQNTRPFCQLSTFLHVCSHLTTFHALCNLNGYRHPLNSCYPVSVNTTHLQWNLFNTHTVKVEYLFNMNHFLIPRRCNTNKSSY